MSQFLFFSSQTAYYKYLVAAVLEEENAKVFAPIKNKVLSILYRLHFAWPMNKYYELPFKSLWFKRLLKGMDVTTSDTVYVIMNENCLLSYSKRFLDHLKIVYPGCKICFLFSNPVDKYILDKLKRVNSFYDAKITFFKDDAIKYGMIYSEMCPYRLPIIETKGSVESDIFFVGRDKGRLDFLIKIYENLSSKGFICDFNIMGVKEEDMKYQEIIQYNKWIPYDEVLRHVKASKCVLEVLQDMDNYVSIKTYEALQYHKKLITTNNSVVGRSFYNPNTIKVVNDPNDDISVFLHNAVDDADFQNGDDYTSFKRFEAEIESMLS